LRWVEQFTSIIPGTRARLAVGLALAAASFFYLAAMANTPKGQVDKDIVGSITSMPDDADDYDSGPSWRCVGVPITIKCGNTRAAIDFKIITAPAR
jgi:hypothetical protein